jgi:hypothetical protein
MDNNSNILNVFLYIINQIKLYHWQTHSYARHKATDELFDKLNMLIDKFIETLTGRIILEKNDIQYRIKINNKRIKIHDMIDNSGIELLSMIKNVLERDTCLLAILENNTDLQNIRDEMLANINQNAYLFTLK